MRWETWHFVYLSCLRFHFLLTCIMIIQCWVCLLIFKEDIFSCPVKLLNRNQLLQIIRHTSCDVCLPRLPWHYPPPRRICHQGLTVQLPWECWILLLGCRLAAGPTSRLPRASPITFGLWTRIWIPDGCQRGWIRQPESLEQLSPSEWTVAMQNRSWEETS